MRVKRMTYFVLGLLFAAIFCLNSGAFGCLPSGDACPSSGKGAEQARLPSEVVFIDPSVRDAEIIVAQLPKGAEVVRLSSGTDAVAQISAHLAKKRGLSAIRIISHGSEGYFVLNGQIIDGEYVTENADVFAEWGDSMSEDADIMLYGCNVAANAEGRDLVQHIADLTGADVAAATFAVGGTDLLITDNCSLIAENGWDLDYKFGEIESVSLSVDGYGYYLTVRTVDLSGDDVGTAGTLRYWIANAVEGDTIVFDLGAGSETITLGSELEIGKGLTINGDNLAGSGTDIIQFNNKS